MTMGSVDLRDVDWVLTNRITEWHREHYLCSTTYREGGLTALLTYKEAGAPSGQKSLPAAVFAQLQARLATASGFASYVAIQQWLREEFRLEVPYKTLHGIVHYQLKAKLKRPRPSHAKKTLPRPRTLLSSAPAALAPLRP
jgi:hypothetical protein